MTHDEEIERLKSLEFAGAKGGAMPRRKVLEVVVDGETVSSVPMSHLPLHHDKTKKMNITPKFEEMMRLAARDLEPMEGMCLGIAQAIVEGYLRNNDIRDILARLEEMPLFPGKLLLQQKFTQAGF